MSLPLSRPFFLLGAVLALGAPLSAQDRPPLDELGHVLILSDGRAMPLDTYARLVVGQISEARKAAGTTPLTWLARLLFTPGATLDDPVFAVAHPDSPAAMGLGSGGRGHYSLRQLQPGFGRLDTLVKQVAQRGGGGGGAADAVEADLLRLRATVDLYTGLRGALDFARVSDTTPLQQWSRGASNPLKVISVGGGGEWLSPESALMAGGESSRLAGLLGKAAGAWERGDWSEARRSLRAFNAAVGPLAGGAPASARLEVLYNGARPYLVSSLLALAACMLWLGASRARWMRPASLALLAAAALVHAAGLTARIVMTGRPPVTSLYSSFLFVAWLLMALGLVLSFRKERLWPVVAPLGAILLTALSTRFSLAGDQLGVLQAVLDTNFWLSTHVVAISVGYTGALAAGLVGSPSGLPSSTLL